MKKLILNALILGVCSGFAMNQVPQEKEVPVEDVFSPLGFDSNDRTEIVITGKLPNLCHQSPQSKIKITDKTIDITVTSLYYDESNPYCPEMEVPFTEVVTLGLLEKGDYSIVVNGKTNQKKTASLNVVEAKSGAIDTFQYALVDYVEKNQGSRTVKLKGYNPSDCLVLDKIDYVSNGSDTYSVLPKMKQVTPFCPMKMTPFSYNFDVPKDLNKQKILLHVRKMDGRSVNVVFDQKEATLTGE
jgi:hypothetical protein